MYNKSICSKGWIPGSLEVTFVSQGLIGKNFNILVIGIATSVGSQVGDLFFSYLKRKAKLKDTGSLLPGHGGIFDRLDSILLGVPVGILTLNYLV